MFLSKTLLLLSLCCGYNAAQNQTIFHNKKSIGYFYNKTAAVGSVSQRDKLPPLKC